MSKLKALLLATAVAAAVALPGAAQAQWWGGGGYPGYGYGGGPWGGGPGYGGYGGGGPPGGYVTLSFAMTAHSPKRGMGSLRRPTRPDSPRVRVLCSMWQAACHGRPLRAAPAGATSGPFIWHCRAFEKAILMRPASQQPKAESGPFFPIACPTFDFCVSVNRDKIRDQFSEHRALAGGPFSLRRKLAVITEPSWHYDPETARDGDGLSFPSRC